MREKERKKSMSSGVEKDSYSETREKSKAQCDKMRDKDYSKYLPACLQQHVHEIRCDGGRWKKKKKKKKWK